MPAERWVHLQQAPAATLHRYTWLPDHSVTMEAVGSLRGCKLDKLQVRVVLPRGERAARAEPEQGTGWGVQEGFRAGLRRERSLANLWIDPGQTDALLL